MATGTFSKTIVGTVLCLTVSDCVRANIIFVDTAQCAELYFNASTRTELKLEVKRNGTFNGLASTSAKICVFGCMIKHIIIQDCIPVGCIPPVC